MGAANLFLFPVRIADWSKHDVVEMLLYILLVHAGDGTGGRPVRWCGSLRAARWCLCAGAGRIKSPRGLPHYATLAMRVPPRVWEAEPEAATLAPGWQRQRNGQSNAGASSSSLVGCQKRWRWV
jgi:hypothetical protein